MREPSGYFGQRVLDVNKSTHCFSKQLSPDGCMISGSFVNLVTDYFLLVGVVPLFLALLKFKQTVIKDSWTSDLVFFQNSLQGSEFVKLGSKESDVRNISTMPPPKKLVQIEFYGSPRGMPPPPRFFAPKSSVLPPIPKFASPGSAEKGEESDLKKVNDESVSGDHPLKLII